MIFNEKHINIFFNVLNQLKTNKNNKAIEAILIELISILNKYLFNIILNIEMEKENFFNINVIIIMIELIENKNIVLLYLFKKLLVSFNVEMNFCKIKSVEILINNLNIENDSEVIDNTLDIIILLLNKNDFIKLFIILDGFSNQLINLLKNENNLENYIDIKIINDLYEILKETTDSNFLIIKSFKYFYIFCFLLRTNFLKTFFYY